MKIYADENVPLQMVSRLRADGHTVEYITLDVQDQDILASAFSENALLITSDEAFERLVLDEGKPTAGVIILRLSTLTPAEERARIAVNALRKYGNNLRGACGLLSETELDVRRPVR